jgi:hypothetical protein
VKVERKGRERGERGKRRKRKAKIVRECAEEYKSKLGRHQRGDEERVMTTVKKVKG